MKLAVMVWLMVVGMIVATVRAAQHKPRRAPADPEEATTAAPPPGLAPAAPPARREAPEERHDPEAIGRLTGAVLFPDGEGTREAIDLTADDGLQTITARGLTPGVPYTLRVPPGRYQVTATAGALLGAVADVVVWPGMTREIDIHLAPGAEISGNVVRTGDIGEVVVTAESGSHSARADVGDDGTFTLEGLVPGRRYEITFKGTGIKAIVLHDVAAPDSDLQVQLESLAVVRGAVGYPEGGDCPVEEYELVAEDLSVVSIGSGCRFELTVPDGVTRATLAATGGGRRWEQAVTIPAHGDPAPVCFNPPCRTAAGDEAEEASEEKGQQKEEEDSEGEAEEGGRTRR
jgi:hypothetical protein